MLSAFSSVDIQPEQAGGGSPELALCVLGINSICGLLAADLGGGLGRIGGRHYLALMYISVICTHSVIDQRDRAGFVLRCHG